MIPSNHTYAAHFKLYRHTCVQGLFENFHSICFEKKISFLILLILPTVEEKIHLFMTPWKVFQFHSKQFFFPFVKVSVYFRIHQNSVYFQMCPWCGKEVHFQFHFIVERKLIKIFFDKKCCVKLVDSARNNGAT